MKIVQLTTDAREFYKDYAASIPYFGTAPEALLQGFAELPGVEVHVVTCARARMQSPGKLAPNIFFHSLLVPKIGWFRTLYAGCIRAVRKKLAELGPDIVHGQGTERDCAITAIFSGFPNVLTIHGNMRLIAQVNKAAPFSYWWLAAQLERFTLPRSRGVVCITRYTQQAVAPLTPRTWVVPNAVDSSFFGIDASPPAEATPRILCVGQICVRKNQNNFIRALDALADKRKFELVFLGQAWANRTYDEEFLGLVRARPWCSHAGQANRQQLKERLQQATLLALPSLEDNCPMVVLEAMAAGVPVVAAKVGGVPDLIEEGKTGFFCDPLDAVSMRTAVETALANTQAAREIAALAKARARERFHPRVIARQHVEVYQQVLNGHKP
jgi:glycosyltransferase involved in cell wall biosynthesis